MRTAYQFHQLSETAKDFARKDKEGTDLYQWLYNLDGSQFVCSTTVQL
jgi:hypothetical protein